MIYTLAVLAAIAIFAVWVLRLPVFGKLPSGDRLARLEKLPIFKKGELNNFSYTPMMPDSINYLDLLVAYFKGDPNSTPKRELPHVKPDFSAYKGTKIIWFGHSSYLIQMGDFNVLVDPVFSERPSPFGFVGGKAYRGTDFVKAEDLPSLDLVIVTHDHYDHLDYQTILKLKDKAKRFVVSLGIGSHLEHWGIPSDKITELAWNEQTAIGDVKLRALPARHFTGRLFKRNQTLWSAFILETTEQRLYLGGDSGYDRHFKEAGDLYGPFDIAMLECGQYDAYWPYIHMFPEETVQAAMDLKAKVMMPVHWGKFTLALHAWNDPIIRVTRAAKKMNVKITTPMLGESVLLNDYYPEKAWWSDK